MIYEKIERCKSLQFLAFPVFMCWLIAKNINSFAQQDWEEV